MRSIAIKFHQRASVLSTYLSEKSRTINHNNTLYQVVQLSTKPINYASSMSELTLWVNSACINLLLGRLLGRLLGWLDGWMAFESVRLTACVKIRRSISLPNLWRDCFCNLIALHSQGHES
jgi:hypothetical protein